MCFVKSSRPFLASFIKKHQRLRPLRLITLGIKSVIVSQESSGAKVAEASQKSGTTSENCALKTAVCSADLVHSGLRKTSHVRRSCALNQKPDDSDHGASEPKIGR